MPIINQAYVRDAGRCFGPIFFPAESYSFYLNFDTAITDPAFDDFRLQIRKAGTTTVVHTFAASVLTKDVINVLYYKIFASFVMPDLPFGSYQFAIVDVVANVLKVTSSEIVIEEREKVINTALIEFRNSSNIYGIRYEQNPTLVQRLRLPLIQTGFSIETDRRQYRNVTNRRLRNLKSYKDDIVKIESYYFDEGGHKAISAVYDHDYILLDGSEVTPKDAYSIEERQNSILSKGSITCILVSESGRATVGISGIFNDIFNDIFG